MCCDSCPYYDDCSANNELEEKCCRKCPDYEVCFEIINEEDETGEDA